MLKCAKNDKTQVKQTYEVFYYTMYNKLQQYLIEHVYENILTLICENGTGSENEERNERDKGWWCVWFILSNKGIYLNRTLGIF